MPKREDLHTILVIGAGPIIIGQACEFDYSGTQACKALKEEGYRVILVNSNPATIMTDPSTADKTYIEPVTPEVIRKIVIKEKPDAILPTIGGQTGLNATVQAAKDGFFEKHNVELIGANIAAIEKAEDRAKFRTAMDKLGLKTTRSGIAHNITEAKEIAERIGFPTIIRSAFTLGGTGGAIAYNMEEFEVLAQKGIDLSIVSEIIVEESIVGWKEYELEVMRDHKDNVVIICSIENFDPMGIHTGDSITVAPQQTLTDKHYQELRDMSIAIIREIGVSTGGSNIQFAVSPVDGAVRIIEMNPRVSRSSALASKATGFPIAKIAAKLAVGLTLDEIPNDITRETPASFEPTIDYVVTKIPRFAFEKFHTANPILGIQMKSVGETMSIGRTFKESFQKAIRGLETKKPGFDGNHYSLRILRDVQRSGKTIQSYIAETKESVLASIKPKIQAGHFERLYCLKDAFYAGLTVEDLYALCKIDRWYLYNLYEIFLEEQKLWNFNLNFLDKSELRRIKAMGFSDEQLALLADVEEERVRMHRKSVGVTPVYKVVDTCAAEFVAKTPYYYSTYDEENEIVADDSKKVMIIGGGPNRIGQGIEFDYMCVHASFALREMGYKTIMLNSNPETVSTDYDVSDILFFDPVTFEDTMAIIEMVKPIGVIVQLGGQTPLNLAQRLVDAGAPIMGTSALAIAAAEDRDQFKKILNKLGFLQPSNGIARSVAEAKECASQIGYPVVVRPSFVLGGRAMKIVYSQEGIDEFIKTAMDVSPGHPILIDKYLEQATEIDVDCICDGTDVVICGIMEHIEEAGVHSGDSACLLPTQNISDELLNLIRKQTKEMALELGVLGLMNVQYAIKDDKLYFLEVNPRGSRTVPFVAKATGIPWVNIAVKVMAGEKLSKLAPPEVKMKYVAIKEAVLPFDKFPDEDTILGPEMKSTGEVMGIGENAGSAFYKSQMAAGLTLPSKGGVLVTIKGDLDKRIIDACNLLLDKSFTLYATEGTKEDLAAAGITNVTLAHKLGEARPDLGDLVKNGNIQLIFNTPVGEKAKISDKYIRILAKQYKVPIMTTISAILASAVAIHQHEGGYDVKAIQDYYL